MNSKVIICKGIKLDRTHLNVLNYSESDMVNLCLSNPHLVAYSYKCSFIRGTKNKISTDFSYSDCLKCNYMAFQNPDYSNKWFFAFIDNIEYKGNNCTDIEFTIDSWHTFFSNLTLCNTFVIREHVDDDTIGKHTVPENLELGEYINNMVDYDTHLDTYVYVVQATETLAHISNPTQPNILATNFGGVPMARVCLYMRNNEFIISNSSRF